RSPNIASFQLEPNSPFQGIIVSKHAPNTKNALKTFYALFPLVRGAGFSVVSGILIVLGFALQRTVFEINCWIAYGVVGVTPPRLPVISLVWLGLALLGIAMISLGWIGVKHREPHSQRILYLKGVASTVGELAFLPHFLLLMFLPIHNTFVPGCLQSVGEKSPDLLVVRDESPKRV
ncbi:MAG: hypothetical protein KIH08_16375, partial [Candidatus Freyarchaeota archaeon]|nr:hypothetical protein [Candidatus Jordarchaeia archaeon]